jgi:hypothetical protein
MLYFGAGGARVKPSFTDAPLLDPGAIELVGSCVEPDLYNRTDESVALLVRATLGDGTRSEIATTKMLGPGDRAHLHLFAELWEDQETLEAALETERSLGCTMEFRIAPADDDEAVDAAHD